MLSFGYYLPVWFQVINDVDALEFGIRGLPFVLGLIVSNIVVGAGVTFCGYYTPFMIACSCLILVGDGLLTTLHVGAPPLPLRNDRTPGFCWAWNGTRYAAVGNGCPSRS